MSPEERDRLRNLFFIDQLNALNQAMDDTARDENGHMTESECQQFKDQLDNLRQQHRALQGKLGDK